MDALKVEGGESFLVDAMAAAHALREMAPRLFKVLTRCHATFVKEREGVCMTYARPHIVLGQGGLTAGDISGDNEDEDLSKEIVAVHWAPPFEGPLSIPANMVQSYYEAYRAFEVMLDSSIDVEQRLQQQQHHGNNKNNNLGVNEDTILLRKLSKYSHEHTWNHRLQPGEVLVFNNMRMLHGRRAFQIKNEGILDDQSKTLDNDSISPRHLVGTYVNIDDSLNTYRTLLRQKQQRTGGTVDDCGRMYGDILNVGNGTSSALP